MGCIGSQVANVFRMVKGSEECRHDGRVDQDSIGEERIG